ncbi:unnamed protein product [Lepeophtheirus salmonis]|uniref:(salmon louse) hypothetical protein n=1 Tax=Lepeophtheirus salmonis TaxID=72036 RepID=A0A817FC15_LEPSM|nr:unnamed protein product [Lepeophtheirus salmonis]CAG9476623.1 unnamed protein product [Lepeophtheirus salmonis]
MKSLLVLLILFQLDSSFAKRNRACTTALGIRCMFPFIYKGQRYSSCTNVDSRNGRFWCPIFLNRDGVFPERSLHFGYCRRNCLRQKRPDQILTPTSFATTVDINSITDMKIATNGRTPPPPKTPNPSINAKTKTDTTITPITRTSPISCENIFGDTRCTLSIFTLWCQ